jgi:hypothetical protein
MINLQRILDEAAALTALDPNTVKLSELDAALGRIEASIYATRKEIDAIWALARRKIKPAVKPVDVEILKELGLL